MSISENTSIKPVNINYVDNIDAKERLNLILFSAGKLVSLLGTYIYSFAISLYILKETGSGTSFALSILVGTLPRILFSPIAGSLADRVDRKKMIVGLDFLSGIVVLTLWALSMLFGLKLIFIYTTTGILSTISCFFNTCFQAAMPKLVTEKSLVKINSYNRAIDSGSSIIAPALGGLVFGIISMKLFFLFNGICFILSAISEMFIDFELNKAENEQKVKNKMSVIAICQDIKDVFHFIRENKILCVIMPFSMSLNFLMAASLAIVLPYMINNVFKMSSSQYGFIEAAFSIGMLLAAILVARLPEKEKKLKDLTLGIAGMGITIFCMGIPGFTFVKSLSNAYVFTLYFILAILFAFFVVKIDIPLGVLIQRSTPNEMLGRTMGVLSTISSSLNPLGIIFAGIFIDYLPAHIMFLVAGVYLIIASILCYKSNAMQEY